MVLPGTCHLFWGSMGKTDSHASVSPLCLNFPYLQNLRKPPTTPGEKFLELKV